MQLSKPFRESRTALFLPEQELEIAIVRCVGQKLISGLPGESLKITHRPRVCGKNHENLPRSHIIERLLRAQYGKRAIESAGV
jgi:hypothetical protein